MEKWTKEERKAIGSRIQKLRKKKGLLQEDLANEIGLKVGTISKYEQGDRTPGIRQLYRISEILECDISELITGKMGAPSPGEANPLRKEPTETAATQNHAAPNTAGQNDISQFSVPNEDAVPNNIQQSPEQSEPLGSTDFQQTPNQSDAISGTATSQTVTPDPGESDNSRHCDTPQREPENIPQTDLDAFIQWLNLSSIKVTAESEDNFLIQIGSRSFSLSEKELTRIMGFLKKQFLKILLQMTRN